jgi:hypothetical protein
MVWSAPKVAGQRELVGVGSEPGDDDGAGPHLAAGDHRRQAALARAEDHHGVAGLGARHLHRPAEAGTERIEHGRNLGAQVARTLCTTLLGCRYMYWA